MRVLLLLKIIVIFLLPKFAFAKVTQVTLLFTFPFVNLVFANWFFASGSNWVKDSEMRVSNSESISQSLSLRMQIIQSLATGLLLSIIV